MKLFHIVAIGGLVGALGCEDPPTGEAIEAPIEDHEANDALSDSSDGDATDTAPSSSVDPAAPVGPPKRIFARRFVVNVRTGPSSEAPRVGYLRAGAVLEATTAAPVGDASCPGGWYELTTGGYVCNGRDVTAFEGERLPEVRAAQPDLTALLPYQYGYSRRDNTAVYRRLPTDEEAAEHEGYVIPGSDGTEEVAMPRGLGGVEAVDGSDEAVDVESRADPRGAGPAREPTEPPETPAVAAVAPAEGEPEATESIEAEPEGPPTLDSLEHSEGGVLTRRMMRGFFVSLDREFRTGSRRYWRTQQNEYIPYHALGMAGGSELHGPRFGGGELGGNPLGGGPLVAGETAASVTLPLGFVTSRSTPFHTLIGGERLRRGAAAGYHHYFGIAGREEHRGREYVVSDDDRRYATADIRVIEARPRPAEVGPSDKWIDVDLERQSLVAYEGDRPVFATLISSGIILREGVEDLDHETPVGPFRVRSKHLTTTMDGDNAFDGPYSIQDVPYVMYYEQGYAIHAAFWHNLFGRPKSHGCINAAPRDARWLFDWADPQLPEGWHGVYPTDDEPGTWIFIHGETPRRRR